MPLWSNPDGPRAKILCGSTKKESVPLRLRREEQTGREVRRGGAAQLPIRMWCSLSSRDAGNVPMTLRTARQKGILFTLFLTGDAKGRVRLRTQAKQRDIGTAAMADAIGGVEHAVQGTLDLPELDIGSLLNQIVKHAESFARGLVEDVC